MLVPTPFAVFFGLLVFFHCSEFLLAAIFMRHELGTTSWLISKPYAKAMGFAVLEFWLEWWLRPGIKGASGGMGLVAWVGLALVLTGEVIRKVGMVTAQGNFTHQIRRQRDPSHQLVTHGIYRWIRHPGYLGWYVWCIGTQVLLCNPVSALAFAFVAWHFFRDRIEYEEYYLRRFFGPAYDEYARRTPTWIPLIP
ncbi:hypothetical protein HYH03_008197 [Edaphochlamys debaryana]|uniref:Protein-S-isoprenylcysteine O-methyltransferase n=1 Tax=Edaphochlamys debaryana TaxID=47281 RepID=A0A835Y0J8_9CHLO|nr:hypothetical protein HYH03_008197 [Edaphochlamys debaryana]|eukprot:KAG2493683.1 hypothetical protein HYH03_008197 [Edaphochlamys debaryana]